MLQEFRRHIFHDEPARHALILVRIRILLLDNPFHPSCLTLRTRVKGSREGLSGEYTHIH